MESIDWSFTELPTDDLTHGLHPYPARFPPALPAALISQLSLPGDLVWDPFGGGGTTAVEALVQRRRCLSSDANPLAAIIGQAKTVTLTSDVEHELAGLATTCLSVSRAGTAGQLVKESNGRLDSYVPHIPNHDKWFARNVTRELAYLRWRIDALNDEGSRSVALCCLSSIIVRVSFQDSETRYASHPRDIPDGFVLHSFGKEILGALRRLKLAQPFLGMRTCEFVSQDFEALEGSIYMENRRLRKRNARVRDQAIQQYGLVCASCGIDFSKYGDLGRAAIDVHHMRPIAERLGSEVTTLRDVRVLCANCHRMVHAGGQLRRPEELRTILSLKPEG